MRKLLCALVVLFAMGGLAFAAEVSFVKYDADKKEITVKEDDKEKTYKFSEKIKVNSVDKDGNATEVKFEDFTEKRLKKADAKFKFEITTDGDMIKELKYKKGKKN